MSVPTAQEVVLSEHLVLRDASAEPLVERRRDRLLVLNELCLERLEV